MTASRFLFVLRMFGLIPRALYYGLQLILALVKR